MPYTKIKFQNQVLLTIYQDINHNPIQTIPDPSQYVPVNYYTQGTYRQEIDKTVNYIT